MNCETNVCYTLFSSIKYTEGMERKYDKTFLTNVPPMSIASVASLGVKPLVFLQESLCYESETLEEETLVPLVKN